MRLVPGRQAAEGTEPEDHVHTQAQEAQMTLEQAMGIIARTQQALVANGFSVGAWGPCGDGIDGRWGPDTRTGWGEAIAAFGYKASQTTAVLATLGVSEFDGTTLQTAINQWNAWRRTQEVGSAEYEAAANAALAAATGITAATCPGREIPVPSATPTTDLYHAQPERGGVPWWLWLLLGLVLAGALGGGIWYWSKYKRTGRRKKKSSLNGYSKKFKAGTEVTDGEFGEDDDDVT